MRATNTQRGGLHAFTLIESLVASAILMIGISAACSLSLAMLTQEEINRRTAEAANYHENVVTLYQLGLDEVEIENLLPRSPIVKSLGFTAGTEQIDATVGNISYQDIELSFFTTPESVSATAESWVTGKSLQSRTVTIRAFRSEL